MGRVLALAFSWVPILGQLLTALAVVSSAILHVKALGKGDGLEPGEMVDVKSLLVVIDEAPEPSSREARRLQG